MYKVKIFVIYCRMEKKMERFKEKYRHELKYMVDERDIALTISRIRGIMKADSFHPEGAYRIRSVYFDDIWDSALMQNFEGVSPRSKYRIRTYNEDSESIYLEEKIKNYDMTRKRSCSLSKDECEHLLKGHTDRILPGENRELLLSLKLKMFQNCFIPKIIVEYERTAFTYKEGNVRVTFDRNLASSGYVDRLWEAALPKRPVMASGQCIMEVKYDEFLPICIKHALNTGKLERITYSKYVLCRTHELSGKKIVRQIRK